MAKKRHWPRLLGWTGLMLGVLTIPVFAQAGVENPKPPTAVQALTSSQYEELYSQLFGENPQFNKISVISYDVNGTTGTLNATVSSRLRSVPRLG